MLVDQGLLHFNLGLFQWTWDCQDILKKTVASDNTVNIITKKMKQVFGRTQMSQLLPIAALFGSSFDKRILEMVWSELFREQMTGSEPQGDKKMHPGFDQLISTALSENFLESTSGDRYRFSHDKVQEAALGLLSPRRLDRLKVCVGSVMLHNLENDPIRLEDYIFVITNLLKQKFSIIGISIRSQNPNRPHSNQFTLPLINDLSQSFTTFLRILLDKDLDCCNLLIK